MSKLKSIKKDIIDFEKYKYQCGIFKPNTVSEAVSNATLISIVNCNILSEFVCGGMLTALNPVAAGLVAAGSTAAYMYKYKHFGPYSKK